MATKGSDAESGAGGDGKAGAIAIPPPSKAPIIPSNPRVTAGEARRTPLVLLADETARKRAAYVFALVVMFACCLILWNATRNLHEDPRIFVVDGSGTIHYGRATTLNAESPIFQFKASEAAEAILSIDQNGYKWANVIPYLFTEQAIKLLNDDLAKYIKRWKACSMAQWPTIEKIEIQELKDDGGYWRAKVSGFVDRRGIVGDEPYYVQPKFSVVMRIIRNPALQESSDWPFKIWVFRVDWEQGFAPE